MANSVLYSAVVPAVRSKYSAQQAYMLGHYSTPGAALGAVASERVLRQDTHISRIFRLFPKMDFTNNETLYAVPIFVLRSEMDMEDFTYTLSGHVAPSPSELVAAVVISEYPKPLSDTQKDVRQVDIHRTFKTHCGESPFAEVSLAQSWYRQDLVSNFAFLQSLRREFYRDE